MPKKNSRDPQVLIVDDDKVVSLLHKNQLRQLHLDKEPLLFSDGSHAKDYIFKHNDSRYSFLVFLDLNMPVVNGWKFLEYLQCQTLLAQVLVVIVTSSVNLSDLSKALAYKEVIGFCRKPFTNTSLEDLLQLEAMKEFQRPQVNHRTSAL